LTVDGVTLDQEARKALVKMMKDSVDEVKGKCLAGKEEVVPDFPMDAVVPLVSLFYAS
jgi:hypothetical protein